MAPENLLKGVNYRVSYRNVKYSRLEFKGRELLIVLPHGQEPEVLLWKHRHWIAKKAALIDECFSKSVDKELFQRTKEEFKQKIFVYAEKISRELVVKPNKIIFRKMKTKWASCSSRGNLIFNTMMRFLPDCLIEYIVFHEMVHLILPRHSETFWRLVSRYFENYKELNKELLIYWILIFPKEFEGVS